MSNNVFKSIDDLKEYTEQFSDRFTPGEIQTVSDETFMWNGTEWQKIVMDSSNSGITMTMYDLNAQIISQLPSHTEDDMKTDVEIINNFDTKISSRCYMMLCKEASYYTLFMNEKHNDNEFTDLGNAVITCACDLGQIRSVEQLENEVEIWVYDSVLQQMYCLHLFNYESGIVPFGGAN